MKTFKILLFCFSFCNILSAQQLEVVNSGGGYLKNAQGSVNFSIGELVIETMEYGDCCLTQGFCQANITVTAINELPYLGYELLAYPNPAKEFIILKISMDQLSDLTYILYDMNGKVMITKQIISKETLIPVQFLIPSTYFLKILDRQTEVKTFKVLKTN